MELNDANLGALYSQVRPRSTQTDGPLHHPGSYTDHMKVSRHRQSVIIGRRGRVVRS